MVVANAPNAEFHRSIKKLGGAAARRPFSHHAARLVFGTPRALPCCVTLRSA